MREPMTSREIADGCWELLMLVVGGGLLVALAWRHEFVAAAITLFALIYRAKRD